MCGIIGYIGHRRCQDELFGGSEALEYRGYDSAGVAWRDGIGSNASGRSGIWNRSAGRLLRIRA